MSALRDVEVKLHVRRKRLGLRRWEGHIEYRTLATRGYAYGSFWLERAKSDGLSGHHPLARARTQGGVLAKLDAEARALGHVLRRQVIVHA